MSNNIQFSQKKFVYEKETYPNNGLINYLYKNHQKVYNSIFVNATSTYSVNNNPRNAIDFNPDKYWIGTQTEQSIITFYIPFGFNIEGYLIKTTKFEPTSSICHPKEWNFYVSKDGYNLILKQNYNDEETNEMQHANAYKYIEYEHPGIYQFFHVECVSTYCTQSQFNFDLESFELYGTIASLSQNIRSCFSIHSSYFSLYLFVFIFIK